MDSEESTKIPCLGRKFELGMLYNCCDDSTVFEKSVWQNSATCEILIPKQDSFSSTIFTDDHTNINAECLDINGELYLSCIAGLVQVDGEAKFFGCNKPSKRYARVVLKCCSLSWSLHINEATITQLLSMPTLSYEMATHIVTQVQYGAISIVVCDQKIENDRNKKAVYDNLEAKANYLQQCINGNYTDVVTDFENESKNISFTIFSSLQSMAEIKTYTDAVEMCKHLSKLHTDNKNHVPVNVHFVSLQNSFDRCIKLTIANEIAITVKKIQNIIVDIDLTSKDLQEEVKDSLPSILEQVNACNVFCQKAQENLRKTLATVIPQCRKGDIEISTLKKQIEGIENHCEQASTWLKSKLVEIKHLKTYRAALKDYAIVPEISFTSLDSTVLYVVSLEFNKHCLNEFILTSPVHTEEPMQLWYKKPEMLTKVKCAIKMFIKFANACKSNKSTTFVITEYSDPKCKNELLTTKLYEKMAASNIVFEPPSLLERPTVVQRTESSLTLTLSQPQRGIQIITSYTVHYRRVDDFNGEWSIFPISNNVDCTTHLENLKANTGYILKIVLDTKIGTSIEGQVSEAMYTAECPNAETNVSTTPSKEQPNTINNHTAKTTHKRSTPRYAQGTVSSAIKENVQTRNSRGNSGGNSTAHSTQPKPTTISLIQKLKDKNKCTQLTAGTPNIFKLELIKPRTPKSKPKHVQKYEFSTESHHKELPVKIILLVGATGAGKTSLLNGMINYIFGIKWEDPERYVLIEKEHGSKEACSQTKDIHVYTIKYNRQFQLPSKCNLTIIDTPGFEDPDGLSEDRTIMTKIKDLLSYDQEIDHLDGVGFVIQAPLSRLTATQKYVMDTVISIFGQDVASNIFVMATFSDGTPPPVKDAVDESGIKYNEIFRFNNSATYANTKKQDHKLQVNKLLWEMGKKSFNIFFNRLDAIDPVSLVLTKELMQERKALHILLEGLQKQVEREISAIHQIKQETDMLNKHKKELEENQNFEYKRIVWLKDLIPLPPYEIAYNCLHCKVTCHHPCREYFVCAVMRITRKGFKCAYCKCLEDEHEQQNKQYCYFMGEEHVTINDIKKKYDKAQTSQLKVENIIAKINEELEEIHKKAQENLFEMHKSIQRINEISLNPVFMSEKEYVLELIAKEKAEQMEGYTHKVKFYEKILEDLDAKLAVDNC